MVRVSGWSGPSTRSASARVASNRTGGCSGMGAAVACRAVVFWLHPWLHVGAGWPELMSGWVRMGAPLVQTSRGRQLQIYGSGL